MSVATGGEGRTVSTRSRRFRILARSQGIGGDHSRSAVVLALYAGTRPFGSAIRLVPALGPLGTLSTLLALLLIGAVGADVVDHGPARMSSAALLALLNAAWAFVTLVWSTDRGLTVEGLVVIAGVTLAFVAQTAHRVSPDTLRLFETAVQFGGALTGVYAIYLSATGKLPSTGAGLSRFEITGAGDGGGGDPNLTAAALGLPFSISVVRSTAGAQGRSTRRFAFACLLLTGSAIMLTASRAGLLILGLGLVVGLFRARGRVLLPALAVVVAVPLLLIPNTVAERSDNAGSSGRTTIWANGMQRCDRYCGAGSGYNTFPEVHAEVVRTEALDHPGTTLEVVAHNVFLESLIESGLPGTVLLVAMLVACVLPVLRSGWRVGAPALLAFACLMVSSQLLSLGSFKFWWLALGYVVMVGSIGERSPRAEPLA